MLLVVFSCLIGLSAGGSLFGRDLNEVDCSQREDAVQWWGCGSFGFCLGGQYTQRDCMNGTVYNRQQQDCTNPDIAQYPCNSPAPDCSFFVGSPGHRMPFMQPDTFSNRPNCSYYYTCSYGRFLGFQLCPMDTVYDERNQRCSFSNEVAPPCGIASPEALARQSLGAELNNQTQNTFNPYQRGNQYQNSIFNGNQPGEQAQGFNQGSQTQNSGLGNNQITTNQEMWTGQGYQARNSGYQSSQQGVGNGQGYQSRNTGYQSTQQGVGNGQGYQSRNTGYQSSQQGMGNNQGYQSRNTGYQSSQQGMGNNQGYQSRNTGYQSSQQGVVNNQGYQSRSSGYQSGQQGMGTGSNQGYQTRISGYEDNQSSQNGGSGYNLDFYRRFRFYK